MVTVGGEVDTGASNIAPQKINVEESRQNRINKLKSKYRDRGGIFQPATENPLIDILLSRDVTGRSPSKAGTSGSVKRARKSVAASRIASSSPTRSKDRNVRASDSEHYGDVVGISKPKSRKSSTKPKAQRKRATNGTSTPSRTDSKSSNKSMPKTRVTMSKRTKSSLEVASEDEDSITQRPGTSKIKPVRRLDDIPEESGSGHSDVEHRPPKSKSRKPEHSREDKPTKRKADEDNVVDPPCPKKKRTAVHSEGEVAKTRQTKTLPAPSSKKPRGQASERALEKPAVSNDGNLDKENGHVARPKETVKKPSKKRVVSPPPDSDDAPLLKRKKPSEGKSTSSGQKFGDGNQGESDNTQQSGRLRLPAKKFEAENGERDTNTDRLENAKSESSSRPGMRRPSKHTSKHAVDETQPNKKTGKETISAHSTVNTRDPLTERSNNQGSINIPKEKHDKAAKPATKTRARLKGKGNPKRAPPSKSRLKFDRLPTPPFANRSGLQLTSPVKVLDSDDDPIDMLS